MLETLLTLTVAHVLADFLLQTKWILDRKRHWTGFSLHILIVAVTACVFTGSLDPRALGLIVASHAITDWAKLTWTGYGKTDEEKAARDGFWPFLIDQIVHLGFIGLVVVFWPSTVAEGVWGGQPADQQRFYFQVVAAIGGTVLAVSAGGIVIDKLLAGFGPHRDVARDADARPPARTGLGLPGGGKAIGWLERAVTLLLVLIGQPDGVGLLLAAKSILRFSDENARAHTEYVIIGTLLSFGWAIASAVLTRAAILHWG
jgi:hypothetical protein